MCPHYKYVVQRLASFFSQSIGRYVLIDINETDDGVNLVTETADYPIYLIDEYEWK